MASSEPPHPVLYPSTSALAGPVRDAYTASTLGHGRVTPFRASLEPVMSPARTCERFRKPSALILCLAFVGFGCGSAGTKGPQTASAEGQTPTEIVHEECEVDAASAVKTDANGDGRPDIVQVMNGTREACRALDLNFDGRVDNYLYFDDAGNLRRRESDFDRDGVIDEIGYYRGGVVTQKHRETNLDGKLDTWDTYVNGRLTERLRDTNRDGKVDQWWTFPDPAKTDCPVVAFDETGDGKPDSRHDPCKEREAELAAAGQTAAQPTQPAPAQPDAAQPDAAQPASGDAGTVEAGGGS